MGNFIRRIEYFLIAQNRIYQALLENSEPRYWTKWVLTSDSIIEIIHLKWKHIILKSCISSWSCKNDIQWNKKWLEVLNIFWKFKETD